MGKRKKMEDPILRAVTDIPDLSNQTWQESVQEWQKELQRRIREYVEGRDKLTQQAMPNWWNVLVTKYGSNFLTKWLCDRCVTLYGIRVVEQVFDSTVIVRSTSVFRKGRVVGKIELNVDRRTFTSGARQGKEAQGNPNLSR